MVQPAKDRLRVAVWHHLPSGGGKRVLQQQVEGLVARGHHVEIWSPPTADNAFTPPVAAQLHVVPQDGTPQRRVSLRERLSLQRRDIEAMDRHCARCAEQIDAKNFDLLLAHPCQTFRVTSIGRMVGCPSVAYVQEPLRRLYEAGAGSVWSAPTADSRSSGKLSSIRGLLADDLRVTADRIQVREEIRNAKGFDRLLVNSYFSRESVLRAYGIQASVCYLGVDTQRFRPDGQSRTRTVISVGYLHPDKRAAFVVEAIAQIRPRVPLMWIGNAAQPDYARRVAAIARTLGVQLDVRIGVPDATLIGMLNRSAVFAYSPRLEPFGLAPIEAAACELPAVGVAEGGVRESVIHGKTGMLTQDDVTGFSEAISTLLDNRGLASALGRSAREVVAARWSAHQAIDRLEAHLIETASFGGRDDDE